MGGQQIKITQLFAAPVETVFRSLTDHETFGKVVNANIGRVVDSPGENKNGVGSVRRITAFPGIVFEETVVAFEQNRLMTYVVSKGSPIKNHEGRMEFSEEQGRTRLDYTIDFEPRWPIPFFGAVLKKAIEKPIRGGIEKLAARYDVQQ